MLGKIETIAELEKLEYPDISSDADTVSLAYFANELNVWVEEAKRALATNEPDRINRWNLDCVGGQGIPRSAQIGNAAPEAQFVRDGAVLRVYGNIDSGFYERFMIELERAPGLSVVELGSGGGSVKDAIQAGREIRRRGLETILQDNCYSACPLVFAGGTSRTVWVTRTGDFGFHRLATRDGISLPDNHAFYELIGEYLDEMGVDKDIYIKWMQSAEPGGLYTPTPQQLCEPNLATFVQRVCADGKRI
jgi:hypothetical protein